MQTRFNIRFYNEKKAATPTILDVYKVTIEKLLFYFYFFREENFLN